MDVLRVHTADFAPYDFMTRLEIICQKAFEGQRVRGEYFDITFEEVAAQLDSHADEVADDHNFDCALKFARIQAFAMGANIDADRRYFYIPVRRFITLHRSP